jgi:hypothetical protein
MRSAAPAQGWPARNVPTVELRYVTPTPKHAASAAMSFARRVCPSIKRSTRSLAQRMAGKIGNEKAPNAHCAQFCAHHQVVWTLMWTRLASI